MILVHIVIFSVLSSNVVAKNDKQRNIDPVFKIQTINMDGNVRKFLLSEVIQPWSPRNTIVSPMAALLPLAQLYFAGDESTEKEIDIAFGSSSEIGQYLSDIIDELTLVKSVRVGIYLVTLLPWMYEITKYYKEMFNHVFNLHLQQADFSNLKKVAKFANALMEEITNGVIKKVVGPEDLSPRSSLVLLGAAYFKGEWKNNFILDTERTLFDTYEGKVLTRYMTRIMKAFYFKSDILKAEIIQLPFKGNQVAFTILLPLETNGLITVLKKIKTNGDILESEIKKMTLKEVNISIPRFKIKTEADMVDVYKRMGIERIFDKEHSGLKNLLLATKPWVSTIKQSLTFVCNQNSASALGNENGRFEYLRTDSTEEAQSEEIQPEITFKASHPFIFYVLYKNNQLFAGVINKPNKVMKGTKKKWKNALRNINFADQLIQPNNKSLPNEINNNQEQNTIKIIHKSNDESYDNHRSKDSIFKVLDDKVYKQEFNHTNKGNDSTIFFSINFQDDKIAEN